MLEKTTESYSIRFRLSADDRQEAKLLAKSKGMTFEGWIGQLIKRELANAEESGDAGRRED